MNLLCLLCDKGTHVCLCCILRHCRIEGNERVDQLAKETLERDIKPLASIHYTDLIAYAFRGCPSWHIADDLHSFINVGYLATKNAHFSSHFGYSKRWVFSFALTAFVVSWLRYVVQRLLLVATPPWLCIQDETPKEIKHHWRDEKNHFNFYKVLVDTYSTTIAILLELSGLLWFNSFSPQWLTAMAGWESTRIRLETKRLQILKVMIIPQDIHISVKQ